MSAPALPLLSLLLVQAASAQTDVTVDSNHGARGLGLGVAVGDPTGLSVMVRPNTSSGVHLAFGWDALSDDLHVHGDYLWNAVRLRASDAPSLYMPFFIGIGGRLSSDWEPHPDRNSIGVAVPLGFGVVSENVPLDVFLEIAPVVGLYPGTEVWLDATLAGHFYF